MTAISPRSMYSTPPACVRSVQCGAVTISSRHGVPFAYPMSPDTGPGLTAIGEELVKACNRLGILIDLAHITEKGFWDVARISDQPLVASHSNVHALTPVARNLTDKQLDAIRESRGSSG